MEYRVFIPQGNEELTSKPKKSSSAAFILFYHFVFGSKWNKKIFESDERASGLIEIFIDVCEEKGYRIIGAAVMPEHTHIIVSLKPDVAPMVAIKNIKGVSSREFHKKFGGSGSLWSSGYYSETLGRKNIYQALTYLGRQDEHHGKFAD